MFREPDASSRVPSLYLDYGVDAQVCESGGIHISDRGMRLRSRWQFAIGSQLAVSCVFARPRLGTKRVTVEGIVVWCEQIDANIYESTLLFLELPDELKQGLREISFELSAA